MRAEGLPASVARQKCEDSLVNDPSRIDREGSFGARMASRPAATRQNRPFIRRGVQ